jgi:peptide/nickel transport system ATP-binding protein
LAGRLLPDSARVVQGDVRISEQSTITCSLQSLRMMRSSQLGYIFQNPMNALDPTMRIGRQLNCAAGKALREDEIEELFAKVELPHHRQVAAAFPHQLSGGMAQRVVIAMAISRRPSLLIADEPTASLDASLRERIMELLGSLKSDMAVIVLSHELHSIARHCDRVGVMYGGRVVEEGPTSQVLAMPLHPYTRALLGAAPGREKPGELLQPIPGSPPVVIGQALNCTFSQRCSFSEDVCTTVRPESRDVGGRKVVCHRAEHMMRHFQ